MAKCILCGAKATTNVQDNASRTIYNCQNCGVFVVSDLIAAEAKRNGPELAAYFTSRKLAACNDIVLLSFDKAKKDKDYLQLTVPQVLALSPHSFSERMDRVLQNLTRMSTYEGEEIKVENLEMSPVFYLKKYNYDALSFIIKSMQKFDLIEVNYYGKSFFPCGIIVSPNGWDRVSQLEGGQAARDDVLVLCSGNDDDKSDLFRKVAAKTIKECGFHGTESVTASSEGKVNYEMIAMIKGARFLITDLTGATGAAYYAAGMAAALGKPNILTCHASERSKVDLNVEQVCVQSWREEAELHLQLLNAIRAQAD